MLRRLLFWAVLVLVGWGYARHQQAERCEAAGGRILQGLCTGERQ